MFYWKPVGQFVCSTILLFSHTLPYAHGRYILPSHSIFSGQENQMVSLIASISNDMFHPDMPLGDDGQSKVNPMLANMFKDLQSFVIYPDGKKHKLTWRAYARFSAADLELPQDGTYRIIQQQPEFALTTFKRADGTPDRIFAAQPKLPEKATDIVHRRISSRVQTFISKNAPNRTAIEQFNDGLEIAGKAHPNDLFINEENEFQLFFNRRPLSKSAKVIILQGGTKHRNSRNEIVLETDTQGRFKTTFKQAGFYWLEAEFSLPGQADANIDQYHYSLYTTLEVFP